MSGVIDYKVVNKDNYQSYYVLTQQLPIGPMLLPKVWADNLWGLLAYSDDIVIGGWVGRKRIANPLLSKLYQEVIYDSHPCVFVEKDCLRQEIVDRSIEKAKADGIALLSISHWSRDNYYYHNSIFSPKKCASFILNLRRDDLWDILDSKQRNIIRKAEKNQAVIVLYRNSEALRELDVFQNLRSVTQRRSLSRNKDASMLLKTNLFLSKVILENQCCLGLCKVDIKVAAGALMIKSGQTVYYYLGGSDIALNRKVGASAYLIWNMILESKKNNQLLFDLGGVPICHDSDNPAFGVYQFKKSFGGDYKEFVCGDFVINKFKCHFVNILKDNSFLKRLISKTI